MKSNEWIKPLIQVDTFINEKGEVEQSDGVLVLLNSHGFVAYPMEKKTENDNYEFIKFLKQM